MYQDNKQTPDYFSLTLL